MLGLSEFGVNPEGEETYTINPQNVDTVRIRTHSTLNTMQGCAHKQDNKYKVATHEVTYVLMTQTNSSLPTLQLVQQIMTLNDP